MQWWSILTMTTVGTVGTLTGCISFCPALIILNAVALTMALKEKSGQARMPFLLLVLAANTILMISGIATIISTVRSLAEHTSYFTPRPEDLAWDEWLGLFFTFVIPEILFIGYALFAFTRFKARKKDSTDAIETEAEPSR
jgi:phosphatidylglycerophosphatase A